MDKRSVAREMAFLASFQMSLKPEKLARTEFHDLCLASLRTLVDNCKDNLKSAESFLVQTERKLLEFETDHPDNASQVEAKPVDMPKTSEFNAEIDKCYQTIDLIEEALNVPELLFHYKTDLTVQNFCLDLLMNFQQNKSKAQDIVSRASKKWDYNRIRKVDKKIMLLTVSELISSTLDKQIIISEALKIASKYSSKESAKFINGILAEVEI
jgi:transcription termination factor NusB